MRSNNITTIGVFILMRANGFWSVILMGGGALLFLLGLSGMIFSGF
jgi:hypothetical protein